MKKIGGVVLLSCFGYLCYKVGKDFREAKFECNKLNFK